MYTGFLHRFFSPLGMAPVVGLVGLGLFQRGFPEVSSGICYRKVNIVPAYTIICTYCAFCFVVQLGKCVEIGIPMLLLVIGVSQVSATT